MDPLRLRCAPRGVCKGSSQPLENNRIGLPLNSEQAAKSSGIAPPGHKQDGTSEEKHNAHEQKHVADRQKDAK